MLNQPEGIFCGHYRETGDYGCLRANGADDWILIYSLTGRGEILLGKEWRPLDANSAMLIEPGTFHHYRTQAQAGHWELIWAHFSPPANWKHYLQWPEGWPGNRLIDRCNEIYQEKIRHALTSMVDWQSSPLAEGPALAVNALEQAILLIRASAPGGSNRTVIGPRIQKALDCIHAHFTEPLPLKMIAEASGLSISRFSARFKDTLDTSAMAYVEKLRLNEAASRLIQTRYSIASIAESCGFNNSFYFSLRFKRYFDCSPMEYRRRHGSDKA